MMADRVTIDQIKLQSNYDLTKLYDNDPLDDEINESPFGINLQLPGEHMTHAAIIWAKHYSDT